MPGEPKKRKKLHRAHGSYWEYVNNVVKKCSHKYVMLDSKVFRNYRFEKQANPGAKLAPGVHIKVVPARCKSYSCPICGRKKVLDLVNKLKHVNLKNYRFFTLTLKNRKTVTDTINNLERVGKLFSKLNNKLKKDPRFKDLQYFRVTEIGKDGMIHIHGIWNKYIPSAELSLMWNKITTDSYIVKVERIRNKVDAVNYLYKYLTKDIVKNDMELEPVFFNQDLKNAHALFYELGKRRFASSRKFFPPGSEKTTDFLPYWFENISEKEIESSLSNLVKEYGLKRENIDLNQYYSSDLFLYELFKGKDPPG